MKQKVVKYNKMLPRRQKKTLLTTPQKVLWSLMIVTVSASVLPEAITQIYNYINRGDSTEIKLPQKEDLLPEEVMADEDKKEEEKQDNQNKNFSYDYLKTWIRPNLEKKLGFEIVGDFDILSAFEINLRSDAFESTDTRLYMLVKPENGGIFCVCYNNRYAQVEIEKSGSQSDAVSSLVAHLQASSIESFSINTEFSESLMQNLPEQNIILVGEVREYIEKNAEKSYMIPVFINDGETISVKTYKALKADIDKMADEIVEEEGLSFDEALEVALENALASVLFGDEVQYMQEYSNQKQNDLSHLNKVLDEIRNDKTQDEQPNKDLFPDDYFADLDSEQTKE